MKVVVCKKLRLIEQKGEKFTKKHSEVIRNSVKISEDDMNKFNSVHEKTGIFYELDEKATKERNESLKPKTRGRQKKEDNKTE